MKLFTATHVFNHPWSTVSLGHWTKYPNEQCPHVLTLDTLERRIDDDGILRSERLIGCSQAVPAIIRRLFGAEDVVYAREVSEVDPANRVLRLRSRNLTMRNLALITETVTYEQDPRDPNRTIFRQEASIEVGENLARWANYLEGFLLQRFRENASRGLQGLESVLERMSGSNAIEPPQRYRQSFPTASERKLP